MRPWRTTRLAEWLTDPERNGELVVLHQGPKAERGHPDSYNTRTGLYFSRMSGIFYRIKGYNIIEVPLEDVLELVDETHAGSNH